MTTINKYGAGTKKCRILARKSEKLYRTLRKEGCPKDKIVRAIYRSYVTVECKDPYRYMSAGL